MPRFIALHSLAFSEDQLRPLAKEPLPEGCTWHSTYIAVAENKSYCHWEAPRKEDLVAIFQKYEVPVQAVYEVRHFDPATGQLEPMAVELKIPQPV
jgi:hypothetical protein